MFHKLGWKIKPCGFLRFESGPYIDSATIESGPYIDSATIESGPYIDSATMIHFLIQKQETKSLWGNGNEISLITSFTLASDLQGR